MARPHLIYENIYPLILEQKRKWFSKKLNPFNLCPNLLTYWIIIYPYSAIGITISDLRTVTIYWRQQIEPNETSYLNFQVIEIKPPFSLTLLILFSALGVTLADAANRVLETVRMEHENEGKKVEEPLDDLANSDEKLPEKITQTVTEEKDPTLVSLLDPFRLTPRLSVFFPITQYTSMGFLTIDFKHIEYSVAQWMEPNGTIECIFRFLDIYAPFPLQIATMSLSVGLFVTGIIYKYGLETREEIINELQGNAQMME